jgi:transposase
MTLSLQKIYLVFSKRRFVYSGCCKVFTEKLPFIEPYAHSSIYVQAIERLSDSSFQKTTKRFGISYTKLVVLLKRVFSLSAIDWGSHIVDGKLKIGIDEHHFGKKNQYLTTIVNLLTRKPIHILTKNTKIRCQRFSSILTKGYSEFHRRGSG